MGDRHLVNCSPPRRRSGRSCCALRRCKLKPCCTISIISDIILNHNYSYIVNSKCLHQKLTPTSKGPLLKIASRPLLALSAQPHHRHLAILRRRMQRREAPGRAAVHLGLALQQEIHHLSQVVVPLGFFGWSSLGFLGTETVGSSFLCPKKICFRKNNDGIEFLFNVHSWLSRF